MPSLDNILLECFANLSPVCRDEELEDIIYFMFDLFQLHSVPISLAEIDIDEVVVAFFAVMVPSRGRKMSSQLVVRKEVEVAILANVVNSVV